MEASADQQALRATAEAVNSGRKYETLVRSGRHTFISDELPELEGGDLGPDPFSYLCGALASCTVITLRMYAGRKGWVLPEITARVDLLPDPDPVTGNNLFHTAVSYSGNLTAEQEARLLYIARACPVHRLLTRVGTVTTVLERSL